MKKSVFTLLILLLSSTMFSQDFSYGLGVGPSFTSSTTLGFNRPTTPKGIGQLIYVFGNYKLNNKFSLDTKLGYDNRVVSYLNYGTFGNNVRTSLKYLIFNPNLKIDLGHDYNKGIYFKTGLRVSQLLSAKDRISKADLKNQFESINLGINLGFGYDINEFVGIELIFDYGLTDEVKNSESDERLISGMFTINMNLEKILAKK